MEQSLFKKYSKFQKFDEILYCGMTRFRNVKLGVLTWSMEGKMNSVLPQKNCSQK